MTGDTDLRVAVCVTQSYIISMSLTRNLRPGGKHGIASGEARDPIGYAVAALSRMAQSDLLDRVGELERAMEQADDVAARIVERLKK